MLLLITVHALLIFFQFLPNVLFLFQDPIQDTTVQLVIKLPKYSLGSDNFSVFILITLLILSSG